MDYAGFREKTWKWKIAQLTSLGDIPLHCPHCKVGKVQSPDDSCSNCGRHADVRMPIECKLEIIGSVFAAIALPVFGICMLIFGKEGVDKLITAFGVKAIPISAVVILVFIGIFINDARTLKSFFQSSANRRYRVAEKFGKDLMVEDAGRWFTEALAFVGGWYVDRIKDPDRKLIYGSPCAREFFSLYGSLLSPVLQQVFRNMLFLDVISEVLLRKVDISKYGAELAGFASDNPALLSLANELQQIGNDETGKLFLRAIAECVKEKAPKLASVLDCEIGAKKA